MKTIAVALAGALLVAGTVAARSATNQKERDLLRGYAFAACLAEGYKGTSFQHDAEHVAGLYMELGRTDKAAVYERLREAARAAHPEKRAAVENANVAIMTCLDLYNSNQVRAIVGSSSGQPR